MNSYLAGILELRPFILLLKLCFDYIDEQFW